MPSSTRKQALPRIKNGRERKGYGNRDVGRGDLTPPPYNETDFVYRDIPKTKKMSVHRRVDEGIDPYNRLPSPFVISVGGVEPRPYILLPRLMHRADRVVRPYEDNAVVYRNSSCNAPFSSTLRRGEVTPPYETFPDILSGAASP